MKNALGRLPRRTSLTLAASLAGMALLSSSAFADGGAGVDMSFDIPDSTSSFSLGEAPTRAFVEGAPSAKLGILELYHTSLYSWLIDPGVQGTITLETPVNQLSIYARRSNSDAQGTMEFLDVNGNVVLNVVPPSNDFAQFVMPAGSAPVAQIRVTNTGTVGLLAIDDIDYCAVQDLPSIGASVCSAVVPNSTGVSATLTATGSPFVQANQLELVASALPTQEFGLFLASTTQGFVTQPGGSQGNLCLGGGIGRFVQPGQIMSSGGTGSFSLGLDLAALPTPAGSVPAVAGETWTFQVWHRDTVNGSATSNFTDAVQVDML